MGGGDSLCVPKHLLQAEGKACTRSPRAEAEGEEGRALKRRGKDAPRGRGPGGAGCCSKKRTT